MTQQQHHRQFVHPAFDGGAACGRRSGAMVAPSLLDNWAQAAQKWAEYRVVLQEREAARQLQHENRARSRQGSSSEVER